MKKIIILLIMVVLTSFGVMAVVKNVNKHNQLPHFQKSESGWKSEDCNPQQEWANMGVRCTTDENGSCKSRNTKCKPYAINPGGSIDELNQFGTDYVALKDYLVHNWGWPEINADSLIHFFRTGDEAN